MRIGDDWRRMIKVGPRPSAWLRNRWVELSDALGSFAELGVFRSPRPPMTKIDLNHHGSDSVRVALAPGRQRERFPSSYRP